jgi:hypothetical protein
MYWILISPITEISFEIPNYSLRVRSSGEASLWRALMAGFIEEYTPNLVEL